MIIYKCRFTGDEMLSDAFKPGPVKDDDGNEGTYVGAHGRVDASKGFHASDSLDSPLMSHSHFRDGLLFLDDF